MRRLFLALLLLALVPGTPATAEAAGATPDRTLAVAGTGVGSYPAFDPAIERYGITTTGASDGSVTVTAATTDPAGAVFVNGRPAPNGAPGMTVTGLQAGDEIAVQISDLSGTTSYGLIYLPAGFRALTATSYGAGPEEGYTFLTLASFLGPPFEAIVDDHGVPVHVRAATGGSNDLKVAPDGRYSVARPTTTPGRTGEQIVALDPQLRPAASYETVGLTNTDFHDSILDADGDRILVAYEPRPPDRDVFDSVIQEVDADGNVVFEWNTRDHIADSETFVHTTPVADPFHINSIEVMDNGDWLASFRNLSAVLRIARTAHDGYQPGEVIWQLGGASNDFTFVDDPEAGPCAQHSARELANGHLLLFDNGAQQDANWGQQTGDFCPDPTNPGGRHARPHTRVTEYALDEGAMTATLVWSYEQDSYSVFAGSAQRLPGGDTFIGWALTNRSAAATEVDAAGEKVWELDNPSGYFSYRAWRFPAPDAIDPEADLAVPADGAAFGRDEVVTADFGCTDRGGSNLVTCQGDAVSGAAVDTSTPGPHTFTVSAVDGAGNTTEVSHAYTVAVGSHQPDALVRRNATPAFKGDGIYGTDGAGQSVLLIARGRRAVSAVARVENDGAGPDRIALQGTRATADFQVRYFQGRRNVTAAVKAGTYRTPLLAPGGRHELRVELRPTAASRPGDEHRVVLLAASDGAPTHQDAVAVIARRT